jgi:hypothetical protein
MSSKTIQINPELFQISENTTRKKRSSSQNPKKIKIKTGNEATKPKNMSTIKRNILKMIRNHQNEKRKQTTASSSVSALKPSPIIPSQTSEFKNDFKESLDFLSTLVTDVEKKQNQTIRRYPVNGSSLPIGPSAHIGESNYDFPTTPEIHQEPILLQKPPILLPPPKYGCLKNGNLPTYRTWLHQTRKHNPIAATYTYSPSIVSNPIQTHTNTPYSYNNIEPDRPPEHIDSPLNKPDRLPEALVGRVATSNIPDTFTNACVSKAGAGNSLGTCVG